MILAACAHHTDASTTSNSASNSKPPAAGTPIDRSDRPHVMTRSPDSRAELVLPAGDSVVDIAASPWTAEAALLVRAANGHFSVRRWTVGSAQTSSDIDLPAGFAARSIAAHPASSSYFVSGASGATSEILAIDNHGTPNVVFRTARHITRLLVGPRPFGTDSGAAYRLFFAASLGDGDMSLRTVTERARVEYQIVGPDSAKVVLPAGDDQPGGMEAAVAVPMSIHPKGEPLIWRDQRNCTHAYAYDRGWQNDHVIDRIPCDGWTSVAPNGSAYLHWRPQQPGVTVIGKGVVTPQQATELTFLEPPVSVADGRGVIGVIAKDNSRSAIEYVPLDMPLGDVANAWQHEGDECRVGLLAREGGAFSEPNAASEQIYSVYDHYSYDDGPRMPFLATTDLFWENFGAAYNGVFILSETQQAMPAFWAFVDSARAALHQSAANSTWAKAFDAIAESRLPNATGEAARITNANTNELSSVLDTVFEFRELMPRGHYTTSPELQHYFRAVHYLTQVGPKLDVSALAALPASVQQMARRWIDVYRPFIAPSRAPLVWENASVIAPYAKHPNKTPSVFPLSWGLDNEVLESTVRHKTWPLAEQIMGPVYARLHPSGLDVATVYGDAYARTLLGPDLETYPPLSSVLDGIRARRPKGAEDLYSRWLDALGTEWADSTHFPGAPAGSHLWDAKRLQTGLASWATLREATILVNERAGAAEAGEGGFEELIAEEPRGYVEPTPGTFEAIAKLFESLANSVKNSTAIEVSLRDAIVAHLDSSAAESRRFGVMAEHELRGEMLSDADYGQIQSVAGSAEHAFLIYKSLATTEQGLPKPEPMPKIADVAGEPSKGVLEVAVGNPLEWRQLVPFFGRREIVLGATYSYHEFVATKLYDNEHWRKEVDQHPHPEWVQQFIASPSTCSAVATR